MKGLQIEQHLKRSARFLEKKQMQLIENFDSGISSLRHNYNQHRSDVLKILKDEKSYWEEVLLEVKEKMHLAHVKREPKLASFKDEAEHLSNDSECKDVHVTDDVELSLSKKVLIQGEDFPSNIISSRMDNTSDTLSQALQEKVSALLLLSQQEERHLLERETNSALQKKMEELRRNLSQVTNEKIEALMELAQLKREYELLQDRQFMKNDHLSADGFDRSINFREREGTLKNILKKTSLKRWMGKKYDAPDPIVKGSDECNVTASENYSMDYARLKVEYATLRESISNIEHLTSSVQRLHALLLKVSADITTFGSSEIMDSLSSIIAEANQIKTALGCSLPVSWFADTTVNTFKYERLCEPSGSSSEQRNDRVVSRAGLEMVELLILATQIFKEKIAMNTNTCS